MMHRRGNEASLRYEARKQREDDSPRLRAEVPTLETLKLEIEERRGNTTNPETTYIRRIVVESAPALFALVCGERDCEDGGHDITYAVMAGLRRGSTKFEGEDVCHGSVRTTTCGRVLHYKATATYRS
ncbi:hypothetical protein LZC95_16040 [Pendulispora brunnea]|uniref:Uncharacterized protein n=1 Tax=Pendulispora brunnea TaxID=2905690 RepID=A0ABZ2KI19_9BACT